MVYRFTELVNVDGFPFKIRACPIHRPKVAKGRNTLFKLQTDCILLCSVVKKCILFRIQLFVYIVTTCGSFISACTVCGQGLENFIQATKC